MPGSQSWIRWQVQCIPGGHGEGWTATRGGERGLQRTGDLSGALVSGGRGVASKLVYI